MISPDVLQKFPLFAQLDPAFLQELAANAEEVAYQTGTWLFREGNEAMTLFLITEGRVELKLSLDESKQTYGYLSTLGAGDTLGWSAVIEPHLYRLGAMTISNAQLIKFDGEVMRVLMKKKPDQGYIIMQEIVRAIASRLQAVRTRVPDLSVGLVAARIFGTLAFLTGTLTVIFALGAILDGDMGNIFLSILCLILPIGFLVLARFSSPETVT